MTEAARVYLEATAQFVPDPGRAGMSLPEQIATSIREQIQFGEIEPGAAIREIPLAQQFGVSRGPVRDALKTLERERLIDLGHRSGAVVRQLSPAELVSVFRIRAELTAMTMRAAAMNPCRDPGRLAAVRDGAAMLVVLAADDETPAAIYIQVRRRVSELILSLAEWGYLGQLSLEFELEIAQLWATILSKPRRRRSSAAWVRIAAAISDGDGALAASEGRALVLEALNELLRRDAERAATGAR